MKSNKFRHLIFFITLYGIAMAFLESAVVVYMRELFTPEECCFPLMPVESRFFYVELIREFSTLIMIISIAWIAGNQATTRFSWFIYVFAIWDIFYYVFLKILLNWPDSLLTYDLLFLIPVTWVGPVITPVIVSLTMILLSLLIHYFDTKNKFIKINLNEWILFVAGSVLIIISFAWDYGSYVIHHYDFVSLWNFKFSDTFNATLTSYIPQKFNWLLFILAEMIILSGIVLYFLRLRKQKPFNS